MNAINRFFAGLRSRITGFFGGVLRFVRNLPAITKTVIGTAKDVPGVATVLATAAACVATSAVNTHMGIGGLMGLSNVFAVTYVVYPVGLLAECIIRRECRTWGYIVNALSVAGGCLAGLAVLWACGGMLGGWGIFLCQPAFVAGKYVTARMLGFFTLMRVFSIFASM
jgi:hypothetical protein